MDTTEIRNRTVSTVISAVAAAATTASFLYMFQDSSDTVLESKKAQRQQDKVLPSKSKETIDLNGPIARGIPKLGDASMLYPDFVGGLNTMASKARSMTPSGLGRLIFIC